MNLEKRIQLLAEMKIRHRMEGNKLELCLDDFAQHLAKCKPSYVVKIKDKAKRDGLWYKDCEKVITELCPKIRAKEAKEFYEKWKKINTIETLDDNNDTVSTEEEGDTDTCASFLDIRNNYFKYKGKKVLVLVKEGVAWFKGIDVAKILDFDCQHHAVRNSVSKEDRIDFMTLRGELNSPLESQKIDPQTIFINQEGMYDLVMFSRKPEAKVFRRWISHEVLPSINRFGFYSIEKKYGCFYDDHDLYEYDGCNVCYIAYIGVHDCLPLFKFGISFDYYRREYQEHRKTFDTFKLVYLRHADNNHTIEDMFKKECKSKDVYIQKEFKGKNRTELFTVNELHSFERMRMIMDKLIELNPTRAFQKYRKDIEALRSEKEQLEKEQGLKIQLHETVLAEKNERIRELQSQNAILQNDKTMLYKLFESLKQMMESIRP